MITEQIFMGAGDHTKSKVEELHQLLDDGLAALSATQQPDPVTQPPNPQRERENLIDKGNVEYVAEQIYLGLTGKNLPIDRF